MFSHGDRRATARKRKLHTRSRCRKIKIVFRNQSIRRTRFLFQRHRDAFFLEPSLLALHRIAPRSASFDQAARPKQSRKRCFFPLVESLYPSRLRGGRKSFTVSMDKSCRRVAPAPQATKCHKDFLRTARLRPWSGVAETPPTAAARKSSRSLRTFFLRSHPRAEV